ncbi:MAG TPA: Rid family hydrolase [Prolixibacteraceae bacterium]|nr:Rid family hydrolase [Prolixibacteraceae bacterium]
MLPRNYTVYHTEEEPFEQMCQSLLSQIDTEPNVIKIVFFGPAQNNREYLLQLRLIRKCARAHFPERVPLISYVSQKPLKGMLNAEVTTLSETGDVQVTYGNNYIVLENGCCRELITEGILPPDISASHKVQSDEVFARIGAILSHENFPVNSIVRQWNYIENISSFEDEYQNYQAFNDSRSHFYDQADWSMGYPAATGIGTQSGGVMVELIAFTGAGLVNRILDNPLQTAAHKYSQGVLLGAMDPCTNQRTTPKFERARVIGEPGLLTVYISGTAAIRGETSLVANDIMEQTQMTMQNIDHLLSEQNYPVAGAIREFRLLRIYVKYPHQMEDVRSYMKANYPDIRKIYICADICREELLIEIEGIAEITTLN